MFCHVPPEHVRFTFHLFEMVLKVTYNFLVL